MSLELKTVKIEKGDDSNFILGQSHFIKSVEDIYEAMVTSVAGAKFGLAFCEASDRRLVRCAGTDNELIDLAKKNAMAIGAGHTFIIMMKDCFPINVLNAIKAVPEVCSIFCATANPTAVVVAENDDGRGIMGVIDGQTPLGAESSEDAKERMDLLRKFGYKLS
jgi:adenosine/AMP kinase